MRSINFLVRAALTLALSSSGWSLAGDVDTVDAAVNDLQAAVVVDAAPAAVATTVPVAVSGFGVPMGVSRLDDYRGGFDVVKNDMQLSGTVANNSATNIVAGTNSIADGAFANASGLPTVIQNSGSNVLIQNATIVNVQYH